ncbi:LOW QUALITY PROTEIN: E3 ubiquitin-protein ligase RNF31 [Emydura macquarii macquarii]|uniref:LOW QUALITY PROTEIN: E3 ubiquitin-protein ligase RNF31 n=1 Tax=Emydura macquarii macquarii TaxID=1129001 RepID=UPI00352A045D
MAQAEPPSGEPQFLQLREELVLALARSPGELHPESVQQLVEAPLPPHLKYREIDARGLLCANGRGQPPACLRTISTALNILEKYGRNLLNPNKPRFWRSVKFNNPVFRSTVDAVQGGRDVLRLYGYTEQQPDGLSFPEGLAEPDGWRVASVTVDVVLLRAELNLLLSNNHPNPEMLQEILQGGQEATPISESVPHPDTVPPGGLPQTGPAPPSACLLCGLEPASLRCPECDQSLCSECDRLFHKHPARAQHRRQSLGEPGWEARTPGQSLPMLPSEPPGARPALPPKPRPPWLCAACGTSNAGRAVLCGACDRPRGCPTPPQPPADGDPPRGGWACQSCTFLNAGAAVLCAVCERPRLAGRPGPPDPRCPPDPQRPPDGPPEPLQAGGAPGWQCEHCTFWNQLPGRVCEVCNRTSQRGGLSPTPRPPPEEKGPQRPGKPHPLTPEEAERRRQEKLREDGMKMVAMIREAELAGVPPEEVGAALRYSGAELPLPWLRSELPAVLEAVAELATQQGVGAELGAITRQEARTAWAQSQGDLNEAVSRCLGARRSKVRELAALGFGARGPVLRALYENGGDVWGALTELQRLQLEPFHRRLWDPAEPPIDFQVPDRQALLRRLLASLALPSWGRAELVLSLAQEQAAGGRAALADIVEAVRASPDRAFIRRLLNWECAVCGWALPRNQMQSLTSCECTICPDCFAEYFTIAVKEKHITDLVCPACDAPDLSDEAALLGYFSTLDIQLRECLDLETYELFSKKLTERELMRDPKFQWCTHCSFGFIYESEHAAAQCPQCNQSFCVHCKRAWEPQHQGLSCQEFQEWKRTNDPQYQAQGLAVYLQENGIACPKCKFPYALARGGCMHFQCSQCRHHFCSGCYGPFHTKNKCPVPGCPVRQSLHGHHPRDCLFYLRDWDVGRLQRLLQDNGVVFNTEPPTGTRPAPGGGCRVMEQKETLAGLRDEACGKETPPGYAGLCQAHYKEYLVSLINARALDPARLYGPAELETVYRRHLGVLPPRTPAEPEDSYRGRLLQKLMDEVPLGSKIPRQRQ